MKHKWYSKMHQNPAPLSSTVLDGTHRLKIKAARNTLLKKAKLDYECLRHAVISDTKHHLTPRNAIMRGRVPFGVNHGKSFFLVQGSHVKLIAKKSQAYSHDRL